MKSARFLKKDRLIALSLTLATVSGLSSAIIDGRNAPIGNPYSAIFALEGSDNRMCTGVLVAPTLIMTAAHCVDGRMTIRTVANGTNVNRNRYRGIVARVARMKSHPQYVENGSGGNPNLAKNDIGYVVLTAPITTVAPAVVQVFSTLDEANALVGKIATLTGYGFKTYAPDGEYNMSELGPKRFGEKTVVQANLNFIAFDGPSQSVLPGDSGGPLFMNDGSGMKVVGLNHSFLKSASNLAYNHAIMHILTPESVCWVEKNSGIDVPGVDCP